MGNVWQEREACKFFLALFSISVLKILGPFITGRIIDTFGRESFANRYMFLLSALCVFLGWLTLQFVRSGEEKEVRVPQAAPQEAVSGG